MRPNIEDSHQDRETQLSLLTPKDPNERSVQTISPQMKEKAPPSGEDLKAWLGVLFGLILSGGVLGAIIVILARVNGHPRSNWNTISLNSAISWLSTVAKACILYAVSQSLGQLKWVWFSQQRRPLSDLECFDSASRGIKGSALLLWLLKGRHFAVLGGLAVILTLAFEPFVQNSVHYISRSVDDDFQTSLLGRSLQYSTTGHFITRPISRIDPNMKANVYNSLMNQDPTRPWAIPSYICPTGNCTWDAMPSLGFEAQCTNITSYLHRNCTVREILNDNPSYECTMSLPSNLSLWYYTYSPVINLLGMSTTSGEKAVQYKETTFPVVQYIAAVGALDNDGTTLLSLNETSPFMATECALVPIVESFEASVSLNVYQEKRIASWTAGNVSGIGGVSITPGRSANTDDPPTAFKETFGLYEEPCMAITSFIQDLFAGEVRVTSESFAFVPSAASGEGSYATVDVIEAIFFGNFTRANCTTDDSLTCAMGNVATAMTKTVRDTAFTGDTGASGWQPPALGRTKVILTFVEVRWAWFTLPVGVWLLGAVTCMGAAWKSYRAGTRAWMTSPLPLVLLDQRWQDRDGTPEEPEGYAVEMTSLRRDSTSSRLNPETHVDEGQSLDLSLRQFEDKARLIYAQVRPSEGELLLVQ